MFSQPARIALAPLALMFALSAGNAEAQKPANPQYPLQGIKVPATAHMHGGKTRSLEVDCGGLVAGKAPDGKPILGLSVKFISEFDQANSPEYMARMDAMTRKIIEGSKNNYSVDGPQVRYMIGHVEAAHGVNVNTDIKPAYLACKSQWKPS